MDQSALSIGSIEVARVIVDSSASSQFKAQIARQEWVSAVEYMCAAGSVIPPMLIFKGILG